MAVSAGGTSEFLMFSNVLRDRRPDSSRLVTAHADPLAVHVAVQNPQGDPRTENLGGSRPRSHGAIASRMPVSDHPELEPPRVSLPGVAAVAKPKSVAEYLREAPADKRAALTKLRRTIKAAAPKAMESISYGMVGYKYEGKPLAYFAYAKVHCALYGLDARAADLSAFDVGDKGTIRFTPEKPLPDRTVIKLIKARIAAIDAVTH